MKEKPGVDRKGPARLVAAQPVLAQIAAAADPVQVWLVGGAVRDALLGGDPLDLDLVVAGDAIELAETLDRDAVTHERFRTAEFSLDGVHVDLATARSEKYLHPGSLPEVAPANIEADLSRRDFTIDAIAVDLSDPLKIIDPLGGMDDLERGMIRVLHERSFVDDPTRALRAARYAARLGFELESATGDLLDTVNLSNISTDRLNAELSLMAGEKQALKAFGLASDWGVYPIEPERLELAAVALVVCGDPPWSGLVDRPEVLIAAVSGNLERLVSLEREPESPSEGVARAGDFNDVELLLARAGGSHWLDHYVVQWRNVGLEITGEDLVKAGVAQGPDVGRALAAALAAKLDRDVTGREAELEAALAALCR